MLSGADFLVVLRRFAVWGILTAFGGSLARYALRRRETVRSIGGAGGAVYEYLPPIHLGFSGLLLTLWYNLAVPSPTLGFKRELLMMKDGGAVSMDWCTQPAGKHGDQTSTAIVLPAFGTSCRTPVVRRVVASLLRSGCAAKVGVLNFRGAAGTKLITPQIYDISSPGEIREVIGVLEARAEGRIVAVGLSMGANALLHYLGHVGANTPLRAAVAISCPFKLPGLLRLREIFPFNLGPIRRAYEGRFVSWFKRRLKRSASLFPESEMKTLSEIDDMQEFVGYFARTVFGAPDLHTYLERGSCASLLHGVAIPLCTLNALDDPVVTADMLPSEALARNANITAYISRRGGHLSWIRRGADESLMLEVMECFLKKQNYT